MEKDVAKSDSSISMTIKDYFQSLHQKGKQPMRLKKYVVFVLFALIFILALCLIIVSSIGINNYETNSPVMPCTNLTKLVLDASKSSISNGNDERMRKLISLK
jgi:hypothetical protein